MPCNTVNPNSNANSKGVTLRLQKTVAVLEERVDAELYKAGSDRVSALDDFTKESIVVDIIDMWEELAIDLCQCPACVKRREDKAAGRYKR